MTKRLYFLWLIGAGLLFFQSSCGDDEMMSDDEMPVEYDYTDGVFIINEGPFQTGTGSIDFYDRSSQTTVSKVYQTANNGEELGNIVQSMSVHNGKAYLIVNNANKIVVVNLEDFKKEGEITGLELPRYFLPISDDKAYVSQWGVDGATGSIKVLDLNSNTVSSTIETRPGPEEMIMVGDFVYVANSGGYLVDSVITKIDVPTEDVLTTIEVGLAPKYLELDKNLDLWVLAGGQIIDFTNPDVNRKGRLSRIVNDNVELSMPIEPGSDNLTMNNLRDKLYYGMNSWVYEHDITATTISLVPYLDQYYYGFEVDPNTGNLYAANPRNFQQDGEVLIFNSSGTPLDTFEVGLIPGDFWFE